MNQTHQTNQLTHELNLNQNDPFTREGGLKKIGRFILPSLVSVDRAASMVNVKPESIITLRAARLLTPYNVCGMALCSVSELIALAGGVKNIKGETE